jgi:predicted pyridoxine 5'-phosphate oxidase superfamily flavin-nucleotide-binding protein
MVSIPQHVRDFFVGKMGWVATATADGEPNVTPKGTVQVLDDEHVVFGDLFSLKTRQNLEQNPKVAVTVIDPGTAQGYQVKGTAELATSGPLFEKLAAQIKQKGIAMPLRYAVKIRVEAVYDQSAGPEAGKRIA